MKRYFTILAALALGVCASAQVGDNGFDFREASMYDYELTEVFTNLDNIVFVQTSAPEDGKKTGKNNINMGTTADEEGKYHCSFNMGSIVWSYTNNSANTVAKQYGNYVQPNGGNRKITIPASDGDKILVVVQDAVTNGVTITGIKEDATSFVAGENEYTATGTVTIVTSTKPKYRAILNISIPTPIANINADAIPAGKAIKTIENGKVIIIRDGVKYNMNGAVVK